MKNDKLKIKDRKCIMIKRRQKMDNENGLKRSEMVPIEIVWNQCKWPQLGTNGLEWSWMVSNVP